MRTHAHAHFNCNGQGVGGAKIKHTMPNASYEIMLTTVIMHLHDETLLTGKPMHTGCGERHGIAFPTHITAVVDPNQTHQEYS